MGMEVKIDTKEKFTVFTPGPALLNDNVTGTLVPQIKECLQKENRNVILNLQHVTAAAPGFIDTLVKLREEFYNNNASFVTCCVQKPLLDELQAQELEDYLNIAPTESEAWDIVQMEEIEREFDSE
jgi:anti-anti-sigma regulatory factor